MSRAVLSTRDKAADLRLRREYSGFSLADHRKVFEHQGKCCAICKRPVPPGKARLAVDHDHTSGLLRGLLCPWCNRALARFKDSIELLLAAANYLTHPPITIVFGREWYTAPGRIGSKKRAKALRLMLELNRTKGDHGCKTRRKQTRICRSIR